METLELEPVKVSSELEAVVKQSGLEKSIIHASTFQPYIETVIELSSKLPTLNRKDPSTVDAKIARELRLALVKNRTATGKEKDKSKATLLAEANLIQSLHNVVVNKSILIEADYEAIEKFAENKEAQRKAALKLDRENILSPFEMDLSGYALAEMSEDTFNNLVASQELLKKERCELLKKQEEEMLAKIKADAEEKEKLRIENEKLKAEKAEAERLEKLRIEKDVADKLEADRLLLEERKKAESERLKAEQEANEKLELERREKNRIGAELRAKKDAELKAEQDHIAAYEVELSKGDKDKFDDLLKDLEALKVKYSFKSKKYSHTYLAINELLDKIINYAISKQ